MKYKTKYLELKKYIGGAPTKKEKEKEKDESVPRRQSTNLKSSNRRKLGSTRTLSHKVKDEEAEIEQNSLQDNILSKCIGIESEFHLTLIRGEYDRNILCGLIQWLIDIAGSEEIMKHIIKKYTGGKVKREIVLESNYINPKPNTIYFIEKTDKVDKNKGIGIGHWVFIDGNGNPWNSYELLHQQNHTNQFCQSFAQIYMLHAFGHSKWFNAFQNPDKSYFTDEFIINVKPTRNNNTKFNEIANSWGNNIRVIVAFWIEILSDPVIKNTLWYLLYIFDNIYIRENKKLHGLKRYELIFKGESISEDETEKDSFILNKFNEICKNSCDIAMHVI